jgi:hypothetical protein
MQAEARPGIASRVVVTEQVEVEWEIAMDLNITLGPQHICIIAGLFRSTSSARFAHSRHKQVSRRHFAGTSLFVRTPNSQLKDIY